MSGRFCGKCGISVEYEDVFCHRCGAGLLENRTAEADDGRALQNRASHVPAEALAPSVPNTPARPARDEYASRRRGKRTAFRLTMALLFWGLAAGTCYVIFRHLASGIPWSDVAAVVTDRAGEREAGNSAAGLASRDDMPPVAQVSAGPGGSTGTPAAREESIWGEPDANGYSVLSARGSSAPRGVVKGSRVRLRAEPNTASKILGHFDDGRVCEVTRRYWSGREKYHWFMVISGQDSGWMYGEYLKMTED